MAEGQCPAPPLSKAQKQEQPFHEAAAAAVADLPTAPATPLQRAIDRAQGVNFRDLHTVGGVIQPGRVYRSSQVVSARELEGLGVKAVLDLRQPAVGCKTDGANMVRALRRSCWGCFGWMQGLLAGGRYARGRHSNGDSGRGAEPPLAPCHRCTHDTCEHYGIRARVYHVDLLPIRVSLRILWELPRSLQARVLWAAARRQHPEPIVAGAVADPQVMGYLKLYILLLERAQPGLAAAIRLAADPANFPLLVHCIHGKDRTGLVAMLLLLLCGADWQAVVQDYALSEVLLLESREKRELLGLQEHLTTNQVLAAAAHVMEQTLDHVEKRYGSVRNYLKAIGLSDTELASIVRNLTAPNRI